MLQRYVHENVWILYYLNRTTDYTKRTYRKRSSVIFHFTVSNIMLHAFKGFLLHIFCTLTSSSIDVAFLRLFMLVAWLFSVLVQYTCFFSNYRISKCVIIKYSKYYIHVIQYTFSCSVKFTLQYCTLITITIFLFLQNFHVKYYQ